MIDIYPTESNCLQESFDAAKSWVAELQNTAGSCSGRIFLSTEIAGSEGNMLLSDPMQDTLIALAGNKSDLEA